MTVKMSEMDAVYRDVDLYMFQDADGSQLHMFMPTYSFVNYFANMDLATLLATGQVDKTNAEAVDAVFDRMDAKVESINLSIVFKAAK